MLTRNSPRIVLLKKNHRSGEAIELWKKKKLIAFFIFYFIMFEARFGANMTQSH